ncbi:MAG: SURF1 family protein [Methyloceanibacter sp.]
MARGLLGFTLLVVAAVAVLAGLGFWQLERLRWKEGLIAKIEARAKAPPIALEEATAMAARGEDPSYYRVAVTGRYDHAKERYLFAVNEGEAGWHVVTPLATQDGETVLIDRGFVPDKLRDPASRAEGEVGGVVAVTGLVRMPETQTLFIPDNDPETNRWFWRDAGAMTRSMFPGQAVTAAPFFLEAEKGEAPGGWPEGGQTRLDLPNNHLQYAITWLLLAGALLCVYGAYVWKAKTGKRPSPQGEKD